MVSEEPIQLHESTETCTDCGSLLTVRDKNRGELICCNCGLVIVEQVIDQGPEWRAFDAQQRERRTRVGAPMTNTIHDHGLSTIIDYKDKDYSGKDIPAKMRPLFHRIREWQRRIRVNDAIERNLAFALGELERMASSLSLSKPFRETASKIYRKAVDEQLIRGRSIEGVAAACLYAACKEATFQNIEKRMPSKRSITLSEIAENARVDKKEIGRSYRFIKERLGLRTEPVKPREFVTRFVSELELPQRVELLANRIVSAAEKKGCTSGKNAQGVAAAAIYLSSRYHKEHRTQRDIAKVSQVTEVTVRNHFKQLVTILKIPFDVIKKK
jgi:transcription initiation factor TFIIB